MRSHLRLTSLFQFAVIALAIHASGLKASDALPIASLPTTSTPAAVPMTPGVALAQDVSELTGVAISPLLGVSAVGAWRFYHATEAERAHLAWYCQPWFWGTAALIIGICMAKDFLGTALPHWLMKPLHILELLENKVSAGLAGGTLVPLIAMHLSEAMSGSGGTAMLPHSPGALPLAAMTWQGSHWGMFITLPLTALVFCLVWISSHALHVLVCMCPMGFLATLLKLAKNAVLALLVVTSYLHPTAGFIMALVIIAIACFFASRAMRLTVYGSAMATDTVLSWFINRLPATKRFPGFLSANVGGLPVRSFGHITTDAEGQTVFESRRFYFGGLRRAALPSSDLTVGQCLFHPVLLGAQKDQAVLRELVHFLPRWRGKEEAIARQLNLPCLGDRSPAKPLTLMEQWAGA